MPDLGVKIGSLSLKNPIMTASGTYGVGREYSDLIDIKKLGAIVTTGITLEYRSGNRSPRIVETPAGILNSIGLQNAGVEHFLKEEIQFLKTLSVPTIVNIAGRRLRDYEEITRRLSDKEGISGLEVNVSCPNVREGGLAFGTNPRLVYELTSRLRKITDLPLIVKLTPNVTDIGEIALSAQEAGADAVSLINTLLGMEINVHKQKPVLGNVYGGLSGPAIRPVALRMVYQVYKRIRIPIIGMGGIISGEDVIAFLLAGASAVALGTVNFVNPQAPLEVLAYLKSYMRDYGFASIGELTGLAHKEGY